MKQAHDDEEAPKTDDRTPADQQQEQQHQQSYAFPRHEEPETPEKSCAICLDDFGEPLWLFVRHVSIIACASCFWLKS